MTDHAPPTSGPELDTESSASRQHYIDTGQYLPKGWVELDEARPRIYADLEQAEHRYAVLNAGLAALEVRVAFPNATDVVFELHEGEAGWVAQLIALFDAAGAQLWHIDEAVGNDEEDLDSAVAGGIECAAAHGGARFFQKSDRDVTWSGSWGGDPLVLHLPTAIDTATAAVLKEAS